MAQKRMFSMQIVDSDAFLDMPMSSQLLYFHMVMKADDEGFLGNPKRVVKMIGASDDDYKILVAKRFLLTFESGVVVIKHWLIHNTIRMDRFNPTAYQEEKKTLTTKENRAYTEMATSGLPVGNQMAGQVKLSEVKISKEKLVRQESSLSYLRQIPEADLKEFVDRFDCGASAIKSKAEDLENYCKSKGKVYKDYKAFLLNALKKDFKPRIRSYRPEEVQQIITPEEREKAIRKKEEIMKDLTIKRI